MNKKNIVENLRKNLSKINDIRLVPSKHRGKDSDWSLSFEHEEGEELDTLVNIFGLRRDKRLENLFASATSGDGNELSRFLTLHSSSLLAFLCFSHINKDCPIKICDTEYVEVMFELKNDVIDPSFGKPSNIDVVLLNEDRSEVLFLESKFTEYLNGGRAYLSPERYEKFFNHLQQSKGTILNFKASYMEIRHRPYINHPAGYKTSEYCLHQGDKTAGYLGGVKQAFSHLLGIATGPAQIQTETNNHYGRIFNDVRKITFATIVYNCDEKKFDSYSRLYNSVFRKENEEVIKRSMRKVVDQSNYIDKLTIYPSLLTYQEIFSDYPLPHRVRDFYNFNQHSHA
ncbi:MAG: hypothetical protein K2H96_03880 [Muribaculaceae bacterium]|nr:hypothetical protein [Muribaculaceae bacterium]